MPPLLLNPSPPPQSAAALLHASAVPYSDLLVRAAGATFPSHRAVLALHSPLLRARFAENPRTRELDLDADAGALARRPEALRAGWALVYDYVYEISAPVASVGAAVGALAVCDVWGFDALGALLLEHALGEVSPANAAALYAATGGGAGVGPRIAAVRERCAAVLKDRFDEITGWEVLDQRALARLLKLNDLAVEGREEIVFWAVASWVEAQNTLRAGYAPAALPSTPSSAPVSTGSGATDDSAESVLPAPPPPPVRQPLLPALSDADVESLIKLVRFPTVSREAALQIAQAPLLTRYPFVTKYATQAACAPRRHLTVETSPLFRPRRTHALTFADRVSAFSRVGEEQMQTSARFFAGVLWHLVVGKKDGYVELYLGALSEESGGSVDVTLDFTVYVARMEQGAPPLDAPQMVRREVKKLSFTRSGQKIGFKRMLPLKDVSDFTRNDTLCIGASLRLRGCREDVEAIDDLVDHSADATSS
jgi:BTB/POZ domain